MTSPLAEDLERALAQTPRLWSQLRGARILLTGGTGFFGSWLLETFVAANDRQGLGATVSVLTRDPAAFAAKAPHLARHPAVAVHEGDVRTFDWPDGAWSHVIHAATDTRVPRDPGERQLVVDTIVDGTRRVLEHAVRGGATRFLLTSTGAVYGRQPHDLSHVPEHFTGGPDLSLASSAGAEAKRLAEALCAVYAEGGLPVTIARAFAFIGPYLPLDAQYAAGNFIRDGLAGGPIRVNGDGTPLRSYLYAADLAVWLWTILLEGQTMRPYNVGGEDPVAIVDLARAVARCFDPAPEVVVARTPDPQRPADRYVPATGRIRSELGVAVTVNLDEALRRTVAWHRRGTDGHVVN